MEKIKILFESLNEKYPDIINEDFVNKITSVIDETITSEIEKEKIKIEEACKIKKNEEDDEEDMKVDKDSDEDEYEEDMKESVKSLVDTLDIFCEEAIREFTTEYSDLINESIKTNISFDIVNKLQNVLSEHGIEVPENIVESETQRKTIDNLNKTIASMTEQISELNSKVEEKSVNESKETIINIVDSVCENMTKEQTLKFYSLIEDYEVDDIDVFSEKVKSLSELLSFKKDNNIIKEEKEIDPQAILYNSISDNKESFSDAFKRNLTEI